MTGGFINLSYQQHYACNKLQLLKQQLYDKYHINANIAEVRENNKLILLVTIYMPAAQVAIFKLSGDEQQIIRAIKTISSMDLKIIYKEPKYKPFRGSQL